MSRIYVEGLGGLTLKILKLHVSRISLGLNSYDKKLIVSITHLGTEVPCVLVFCRCFLLAVLDRDFVIAEGIHI